MKKLIILLCAACALLLTFSCKKEVPAALAVVPDNLSWEWNETTPQAVTVTANYEWTASVSDEANWTITPAADGSSLTVAPKAENKTAGALDATVTITCRELVKTITCAQADTFNGHEYVDLSLPSGVLWASCNLGTTSPEDYGDYYAYGLTTPYIIGTDTPYWTLYFSLMGGTATRQEDCGTDADPLKDYVLGGSKYSKASSAGIADGIAGTEWDAATKNWKGGWRLPSEMELDEIISGLYTTKEWYTAANGAKAVKIISKQNGKYIILTAGGYLNSLGKISEKDSKYSYCVSTPYHLYNYELVDIYLKHETSGYSGGHSARYCGKPVRPVIKF